MDTKNRTFQMVKWAEDISSDIHFPLCSNAHGTTPSLVMTRSTRRLNSTRFLGANALPTLARAVSAFALLLNMNSEYVNGS